MNKYLVKVADAKAFIKEVKNYRTTLSGTVLGGVTGGYIGSHGKVLDTKGSLRNKTKYEKILGGIGGTVGGAYLGAVLGVGRDLRRTHGANWANNAKKDYHYHNSNGGSYGGFTMGRTIKDIHKDLGVTTAFKTKAEAQTHFRRQASKWHPDKHQGVAKEKAHTEMSKVNAAWNEFKKHPDGFEKLANTYLTKIAGADTIKKIVALTKANPGAVIGGTLGAADGALSTTKTKNDSHIRYRLRQLRNVGVGAGIGAAIGVGAQKIVKQIV